MCGPVFKLTNMTMNLLPYVLVIWGFYTMAWGMTLAGKTDTLRTYMYSKTCSAAGNAFAKKYNNNCGGYYWKEKEKVLRHRATKKDFDSGAGLILFMIFNLMCLFWMGLYVRKSGLLSETYGTVGYHSKNVKAMRKPLYKCFGYFIAFVLGCMAIFGFTNVDDDAQMQIFVNGLFQVVIGLVSLISPVPDTIEYGDNVKSIKITSKPWTKSQDVLELFQDAVAAARSADGETHYLKEITGCSDSDVAMIMEDVNAIPFVEGYCACLCGGSTEEAGDEEDTKRSPEKR